MSTPLRPSQLTPQATFPNPAAGYKIPIDKSTDASAVALDITLLFGGQSLLRTVEEIYPFGAGWNMRTTPILRQTASTLGISSTLGIIAAQVISVIDDQGNIHDAHGMYDLAFNTVPFIGLLQSNNTTTGHDHTNDVVLSGVEGKSLSVRCIYLPSVSSFCFMHNYATNEYMSQGGAWASFGGEIPEPPITTGTVATDIVAAESYTTASATNLESNLPLTIPIGGAYRANQEANYIKRLYYFSSGAVSLRGYVKVIRQIS